MAEFNDIGAFFSSRDKKPKKNKKLTAGNLIEHAIVEEQKRERKEKDKMTAEPICDLLKTTKEDEEWEENTVQDVEQQIITTGGSGANRIGMTVIGGVSDDYQAMPSSSNQMNAAADSHSSSLGGANGGLELAGHAVSASDYHHSAGGGADQTMLALDDSDCLDHQKQHAEQLRNKERAQVWGGHSNKVVAAAMQQQQQQQQSSSQTEAAALDSSSAAAADIASSSNATTGEAGGGKYIPKHKRGDAKEGGSLQFSGKHGHLLAGRGAPNLEDLQDFPSLGAATDSAAHSAGGGGADSGSAAAAEGRGTRGGAQHEQDGGGAFTRVGYSGATNDANITASSSSSASGAAAPPASKKYVPPSQRARMNRPPGEEHEVKSQPLATSNRFDLLGDH